METEQEIWTEAEKWKPGLPGSLGPRAQLALVFGSTELLQSPERIAEIRAAYPAARMIGCSTAGEIAETHVRDDSLSVTAVHFDGTEARGASIHIADAERSFDAGKELALQLCGADLRHVFVLSDGMKVNGSELVKGLSQNLPPGVSVTGGLSADGERFGRTYVLWGQQVEENMVAAIGFYGNRVRVGYGSLGGWDPFGPDRLITKSHGNVLYEVDGRSALELYKKYLGDYADDLPSSGLLFPLLVRANETDEGVVRTILAVNEKDQSMTFAGDVPQGSYARLMKANFDRLIDGATGAAQVNVQALGETKADLAILISCVGRRLVLRQRTEEEIEAVREVLGSHPTLTGYYSYGEISPLMPGVGCNLHNQTMTITTFSES